MTSETNTGTQTIQQFIEKFTSEKIGEDYQLKPLTLEEKKAKFQWKVDIINDLPGDLKYINCEKCKNRGYTAYINDDLVETYKTCECMKVRECYQMMERSGIAPDMLRRFTFQNFEDTEPWQLAMKTMAMEYAKSDLSQWLVFSGQSGCGKTHLCTAVSRTLLAKGYKVKYLTWSDIARRLTALKYKEDEYDKFFSKIVEAEVLYIDDFFKTYRDPAIAFDVINARYCSRERRATIISTEMNLDALHKIDEALAGRIRERSQDFCYQVRQDPNRNYRYKMKPSQTGSESR